MNFQIYMFFFPVLEDSDVFIFQANSEHLMKYDDAQNLNVIWVFTVWNREQ